MELTNLSLNERKLKYLFSKCSLPFNNSQMGSSSSTSVTLWLQVGTDFKRGASSSFFVILKTKRNWVHYQNWEAFFTLQLASSLILKKVWRTLQCSVALLLPSVYLIAFKVPFFRLSTFIISHRKEILWEI